MARGPRRPGSADITVNATVRARRLRFGEVPQTSTEFFGTPGHESASGSDRTNLPERVEKDVTYRDVRVDYRLAAALPAHVALTARRRNARKSGAPSAGVTREYRHAGVPEPWPRGSQPTPFC